MSVDVEFYEERAISVALPDQVILTVADTEPVVKGLLQQVQYLQQ